MEDLISSEHGASQLIATLIVVLSMKLLWHVFIFLFNETRKKDQLTESTVKSLTEALHENTTSLQKLDSRMHEIETQMIDLARLKQEIRKILEMIRHLAGAEWISLKEAANKYNGEFD